MRCDDFRQILDLYREDRLSASLTKQTAAHLETCSICSAQSEQTVLKLNKPVLPAGLMEKLTAAAEDPDTEDSDEDPEDRERDQKLVLVAAAVLAVVLGLMHISGPGVMSQKNIASPLAWSAQ